MKLIAIFKVEIEVPESDDLDIARQQGMIEAQGMSNVLFADTKYNRFQVADVTPIIMINHIYGFDYNKKGEWNEKIV